MMKEIGVAHLSALELAPAELITIAARIGYRHVGLRLHPVAPGALAYRLRAGNAEVRRLRALLRAESMRVADVEFISIDPGIDVDAFGPLFEVAAELGARSVTVSGDDPVRARLVDHLARFAERAAQHDLRIDLEFMRWRGIGTLHDAIAVLEEAKSPNVAILVDALHLSRSGAHPDDLLSTEAHVRAVQLCDAAADIPRTAEALIREAREARLPPGHGNLPLCELIAATPNADFSVETPDPRIDHHTRLASAFEAARKLLDAVEDTEAEC